ncbi:alpha/beta fold hydrolase [Photobacterium sp. BZF1]|uniref:alpha/beta fold hydrolase n=1 Tax=Photobacterium sp. BZF1 TaxID=1904457 RepID=UPI0016535BFC|nr:alpha/beta fold hydrolase [Photobacterium sp. BZF1]MBC7002240.1 alpha/beta fold hydrolase [Photobacterium sp. BZF1]
MIKNTQPLCLALVIAATLTACNEIDTSEDPRQYVPFNLDQVIYPNDILLTDSDGTLELEQEANGDEVDYRNYENVYGALDGWSTGYPIVLPISGPEDALDTTTLTEKTYILNVETGQLLKPNEDYVVEVTESGDIRVLPKVVLPESTTFVLALSDGITDIAGNTLRRSNYYQSLTEGDNLGHAKGDAFVSQIQSNHNDLAAAGVQESIVYSARFTTQSIYPVMEAAKANIPEQGLKNIKVLNDGKFAKVWTYEATIEVPYYLEMPNASNCEVAALYPEGSEQARTINIDPVSYCEPLYSWWKDGSSNFVHGGNPEPVAQSVEEIPVLIYAPKGWTPDIPATSGVALPASIFVHGITGWKESAQTMAESVVGEDRLVVAIDQPLHGARGVDLNGDGVMDITTTSTEENEDKSVYLNLLSPLTLRDNQRQAVIDQLALRKALNSTPYVDTSDVSLIGHSLGGIVSTMVSELSQTEEALKFSTVTLVVPGMHLTDLVMNSDLLGDEVANEIKESSDIQLMVAQMLGVYDSSEQTKLEGLNALEKFKFESDENEAQAEELEQTFYDMAVADMFPAVQAAVDSGDPANFTTQQANNPDQPILLIEAAGTCDPELGDCQLGEDYLPDTVVPNKATGLPLVGTEPLIDHLSLINITDKIADQGVVKGAIRVMHGGHGSYLFPYEGPAIEVEGEDGEVDLVPAPIGHEEFNQDKDLLIESMKAQQVTIAEFIRSKGTVIEFDSRYFHTEVK